MPRGTLTKNDIKYEILRLMDNIHKDSSTYESKQLAKKYFNLLLDKLEEYAR